MSFSSHPSAFAPSRAQAARLDVVMRGRLANSLQAIAAELGDNAVCATHLTTAADAIRSHAVSPLVFARYFELVRIIAAGRDDALAPAVAVLADEFRREQPLGRWLDLDDADLGSGGARAVGNVIDDEDGALSPGPVGVEAVRFYAPRLREALDLIARADREQAGELDVFARHVILGRSTRPGRDFGGATSPFLWGAIVLNPGRWRDRLALVEALIHEGAHALLFGLSAGQPLAANDRAERYASPLRADPRPMEGIVHATFVVARMIDGFGRLLASDALSEEEYGRAAASIQQHRLRFSDGMQVIDAQARLTGEGHTIIETCRRAMDSATASCPTPG